MTILKRYLSDNTKKKILRILRIIKDIKNYYFGGNVFKNNGKNNKIVRNMTVNFLNTEIIFSGNNNTIKFGNNCNIFGLRVLLEGDNNEIMIGNNVGINASKIQPTVINAVGGKKIVIEDGCLFSNNIEIHTSDYHGIYDKKTGKRLNYEKDILIRKNVWIGLRATILKGTQIAEGCVVGAGSLLAGDYSTPNAIIAGNPAMIIKNEIIWNEESKDVYKVQDKNS